MSTATKAVNSFASLFRVSLRERNRTTTDNRGGKEKERKVFPETDPAAKVRKLRNANMGKDAARMLNLI